MLINFFFFFGLKTLSQTPGGQWARFGSWLLVGNLGLTAGNISPSGSSQALLWSFLPFSCPLSPLWTCFVSRSFSSLTSLSHCLLFFHQITSPIFRAGQRVTLACPGTFTAVLCWVSLESDSSHAVRGSEMGDCFGFHELFSKTGVTP